MFGSARESVLTLMQKSVSVESAAAEKMFNAGVLMESAANKAAGRESGWSSRTASSNTQAGFIAAAGSTETTSGYGWRTHPITGKRSFHGGVDIKIPSGTPLYSLFDGQVISSGYQDNIGNFVKIKHPSRNITSLYGHLSELGVKAGDKVYAGQPIGVSGATGRVTGPHLHLAFQDMQTGTSLDPNVVLKNTPLAFNKENLDEAFLQRLKDSGKFAQVKYKGTAHYISALGELSAQDLAVKLGISETAAKRMKNGEIDKNVAGLGTLNIGSVINMHSENNATAVSEETKREEESSSSKEQAYHRIYMPAIDSGIL
jgi:murein DD-endopeptidase MepM/ murein hydrolase activator NlpD